MVQVLRALSECLESLDSTGTVIKYRRDYLHRFAADPAGFTEELRLKNISSHLKRGYHFKKMGLSNIDDAIREFRFVLSLDPEHSKASKAIKELKKKAEESGITKAAAAGGRFRSGETLVLPEDTAVARAAASEDAAAGARGGIRGPGFGWGWRWAELTASLRTAHGQRRAALVGIVVVVLVVGAWIVLSERAGKEEARGPGAEVALPPSRTGEEAGLTARTGWLAVTTEPAGAGVGIRPRGSERGFEALRDRTPLVTGDLDAGDWELRLELTGYLDETLLLAISAGDTTRQNIVLRSTTVAEAELAPVTTVPERAEPVTSGSTDAAGTGGEPDPSAELATGSEPGAGTQSDLSHATGTPETPTTPEPGQITVTSDPTGAKLYLRLAGQSDFTYLGNTPLTTDELAPGLWEIRVEQDGYQGSSAVVRLQPGEKRELPVTLAVREAVSPATPLPDGYIRLVVTPYADVYLDRELIAEGRKVLVMPVAAGRPHRLELRHPATYGHIVLADLVVASGDTLALDRQVFRWGSLKVGANVQASVTLDGKTLGSRTPCTVDRIAAGEHTLTVYREGFTVAQAVLIAADGSHELTPVAGSADLPRFRIEIGEGLESRVRFVLETTP
jgi:hypothetical protein